MRTYPTDKEEFEDLEKLNAKPWQIDLLKKNPSYVFWGNHEDYMSGGSGWDGPLEFQNIQEGGLFGLDEYNELVHFYFEINRESEECSHCKGQNLNPETKKIYEDWYAMDNIDWAYTADGKRYNNNAWCHHITEVEIEALVKEGRLSDLLQEKVYYEEESDSWYKWEDGQKVPAKVPIMPTPEAVNEWNKSGFGHDAINRWIAVRARAEHLGVYGECEHCEDGYHFTEPEAKTSLQLWYLHPRKGASRGVYIREILEKDVPEVLEVLKEAKKRNEERFSNL